MIQTVKEHNINHKTFFSSEEAVNMGQKGRDKRVGKKKAAIKKVCMTENPQKYPRMITLCWK